ncbi:Pentatricopeptide repeat [Macleaya cordata]|uniref:Pentatricopeptide repeat n=1 Tax=Macleaya cordata TaxID=56857 RepID=A0A200Q9A9_MACCD|nr:Pentatricopeptide repeat [Macleaya cordata]
MSIIRRSSSSSSSYLPSSPIKFLNHRHHHQTSSPSFLSIETLFKKCKTLRNLQQIHARIIQKGLEQDNFLISQFVCLCNSFSNITYAFSVFNRVSQPNLCLWNSIIKGHCEKSSLSNTISIFNRMKQSDMVPDTYTFPPLIKSCSKGLALREGKILHGLVVRYGVEADIFVRTSLIDLYGKCGEIKFARMLFEEMSERNEYSWTAMIVGYANFGDLGSARKLFDEIPCRNIASWNAMIDGYVKFRDFRSARELFEQMPKKNVVAYTSLIVGYAEVGDMATARFLFDQMPDRDIVVWSALISGYVQNGRPHEAVKIFFMMLGENIKPDEFIMVGLMSACSQVRNLELAKWIDSYLTRISIDIRRVHVAAALIHMNAECGNMERATSLFEGMPKKDLISYCSMIHGLSIHGAGAQAVCLFDRMVAEGVTPDDVAFTVILAACSHSGLVEEGHRYFNSMKNDYSIVPSPDHFACMIHLLGRAGKLQEACELIKSMPEEPHAGAWGALLGACKLHSNVKLGEIVALKLFEIEPQNPGNYVSLSNIYAAIDRWYDVSEVRRRMKEKQLRKLPGCSWIDDGFFPFEQNQEHTNL